MKRFWPLLLLFVLSALPARAQLSNAQGWCEAGAQPVVTSGLTSTTLVQASFPQCTVQVNIHGAGTAMIFSTGASAPLANPFQATTNGRWIFYAANGEYDIVLSGAGFPSPVTYSDIFIGTSGGGGGSPGGISGDVQTNNGAGGFAGGTQLSTLAVKAPTAASVLYFGSGGNDSNDGLSPGSAMLTGYHALCSLPGGNCTTKLAGSGTILCISVCTWGGPVANQGMWVMNSTDPNFASPPSGWLKWNGSVLLDCLGGNTNSVGNVNGSVPGGDCNITLGARSLADPAFWFSGGAFQYKIRHIVTPFIWQNVRLGQDSNGANTNGDGGAQQIEFDHDTFQLDVAAGGGPCIYFGGNVFWVWITNSLWQGNSGFFTNLPANDTSQGILAKAPADGSQGKIGQLYITNNIGQAGGIEFENAPIQDIVIDNFTTENNIEAAVWINGAQLSGGMSISHVNASDCTGIAPACSVVYNSLALLTGNMNPNTLISVDSAIGTQSVVGAYQYVGGTETNTVTSPLAAGAKGVIKGHVIGWSPSTVRINSPTQVRWVNFVPVAPVFHSGSACGGSITTSGIADPWGSTTTGAFRVACVSGTGQVDLYINSSTPTINAGDRAITFLWMRAAGGYNTAQISSTSYNHSYAGCNGILPYIIGDGEWELLECLGLPAPAGDTGWYFFSQAQDATHTPTDYFVPGVVIIPASAGISNDEAYEIANSIVPYPSFCVVAQRCNAYGSLVETTSAPVDLTAQAINISPTTFYAVPATGAGFYRFSCYTVITQAATTSGTMPNCLVAFTDKDTGTVTTSIITQFNSSNVLGSIGAGGGGTAPLSSYAYVKASTNIQYSTTGYASSGATALQYALHLRLEYLGP